jgi:DNA-binding MarR family transcriptional regulator
MASVMSRKLATPCDSRRVVDAGAGLVAARPRTYAARMTRAAEDDAGEEGVGDDTEAWRSLLLAHAGAVRAIEHDVQRDGIPLTWYDVLRELELADSGQLRMQELSDRVVLSRTRVSRLVDEMAAQGLVRKRPDVDDRRSTWAVVTDEGRDALRTTEPQYLAGIREHFTRYLTPSERRAVATALGKVAAAHGLAAGPMGPARSRS